MMKPLLITILFLLPLQSFADNSISTFATAQKVKVAPKLNTYPEWDKAPQINLRQLKKLTPALYQVNVAMQADPQGNITAYSLTKSSGDAKVDQLVKDAIQHAKFKPYLENGVAYPFIAEQPFEIELKKAKRTWLDKLLRIE